MAEEKNPGMPPSDGEETEEELGEGIKEEGEEGGDKEKEPEEIEETY